MKTIETKVYTFDELSDKAKDVARDWCRESSLDDDWYDSTYDDAATIGLKITAFDLDRNRHAEGEMTSFAEDVANRIMVNHGKDTETFKLAKQFMIDVEKRTNEESDDDHIQHITELNEDFERDLLEEYSIILQHESDYMNTAEYIDEILEVNEYTFTESGKRFG